MPPIKFTFSDINVSRSLSVEDPADDFVRLRDYVDSKNCLSLAAFSSESVKKGYCAEMAEEANKAYKLCKKQARRVYEIVRLKYTNMNDEAEYKEYRVNIKQRLNRPFQVSRAQRITSVIFGSLH